MSSRSPRTAAAPRRKAPAAAGRTEILRAATREFADHGYDGASTAGIARRAGVTQPLVHHHFGSKQGLWEAVLEALFGDLQREVRAGLRALGPVPREQRLRALIRAVVRFSGARPELSRLIRTESSGGGQAFEGLYRRWLQRWLRFFAREVRAGVEEGVLRELDPRLAYFAMVGAATALFAEPLAARRAFGLDASRPATVESYADVVVDLLLQGLLRRPVDREAG